MDHSEERVPISFYIVALLFLLTGLFSALRMIELLGSRVYFFDFCVLGLFIGPGLVNRNRGWRTCALVFLWFFLLTFGGLTIGVLLVPRQSLFYNGRPVQLEDAATVRMLGATISVSFLMLTWWAYRVLTRPVIRRLFGLEPCFEQEPPSGTACPPA